jgi:eukaryotic-like serine/threonine-protein kinase
MVEVVQADPADDLAWLALADWLEESGQPGPAEIHRLSLILRRPTVEPRWPAEERLGQLLASGVRPVMPTETLRLGIGVELKMALIPPGTFLMGSPENELGHAADEGPVHRVTLSEGFYLGIYPVTQAQWKRVMGDTRSRYYHDPQSDDRPVTHVPWAECQRFCAKLTNGTGRRFRLPTEAEWEYACRAGTSTPFHFGDTISVKQANYNGCFVYDRGRKGTYRQHTMSVGSFAPNAFGLYDMHGNIDEWCMDAYAGDYYRHSPETDPRCFGGEGAVRVHRGGAWSDDPADCRSASRSGNPRLRTIGFRIVMELE